MSHYDTLGVSRGATLDEVKAAFRAKASAAHPDRGGSTEDMQVLNRAYACLSDSEARAAYDATGSDTPERPIEDEARDMLMGAFGSVMDADGDWLAGAAATLHGVRSQIEIRLADNASKQARLVRRRDLIRSKAENLIHMMIDQKLGELVKQAEAFGRARRVQAHALVMLKAYEADPEAPRYDNNPWMAAQQMAGLGWIR